TRVGPRQQHLESDSALQFEVPRPVNDSHAAVAENPLNFVAVDRRQAGFRRGSETCGSAGVGRGEQLIDLVTQAPQALQSFTYCRYQVRLVRAQLFPGGA